MTLPNESVAEPTRPAALNRLVLAALLLCGPVLTMIFWFSMSIGSRWPYRESDLVNGIAATAMAVLLLVLAALVVVRRRRGDIAIFVTWGSAAALAVSGIYCGWFGIGFLHLGAACRDPYCMYEIVQIFWWFLWFMTWVMVAVLALIGATSAVRGDAQL